MVSKNAIKEVKKFLKKNNNESGAPFSACTFGNAFTGEEVFIGEGDGRCGKKISKDMYWRDASMTKLLGSILLGAAIEDGIIKSVDDPVSKYIPEFSSINSWVSGSTPVLDGEGQQTYDKYGTPCYTQVISTEEGLGNKITLRMLLLCSSGLAYSFWGLGSTRALVNIFQGVPNCQNYIAWLQNIENTNGSADVLTSYYDHQELTFTESILERIVKYPLLFYPGTQNVYEIGISVIGGAIGGGLKLKGICKTGAEYCHERIFDPLEIKTYWLGAGSLNPPCDVKKKLTEAFFVRQSYVDGQAGPDVKLNTLYGVFDKQARGDGFVIQANNMFLKRKDKKSCKTDLLAGGYDCSGCGTMTDFCKFLQLLINKGVNKSNNVRVLQEQTVEWLLTTKYTVGQQLTGFGTGTFDLLGGNQLWCGGFSKFNENSPAIPFPCGPNTYTWGGYWATTFYFDTETGNYLMSGTQVSNASWYLNDKQSPPGPSYQPNASYIWSVLCTHN